MIAGLNQLTEIEIADLTGAARRILGIIGAVKGHPAITAMYITLGLCVVAQKVQTRRVRKKRDLKEKGWGDEMIKNYLKDQIPIWFAEEVGWLLFGDLVGKLDKHIVEGKGARIIVGEVLNEYMDFVEGMKDHAREINARQDEADMWIAEVKQQYTEEGVID